MPLNSFKETTMFLLGISLLVVLYYLKISPNIFEKPSLTIPESPLIFIDQQTNKHTGSTDSISKPIADVLIPQWYTEPQNDFNLTQTTGDDLVLFANQAIEQENYFFPEKQNALYYLLIAKDYQQDQSITDPLFNLLAEKLYLDANQAITDYDFDLLSQLTSRLKTIDSQDRHIKKYTNSLNKLNRINKFIADAKQHFTQGEIILHNNKDALHSLKAAQKIYPKHPELIKIQQQIMDQLLTTALRAAEEHDYELAERDLEIATEINPENPLIQTTQQTVQDLKQNRFTWLDQQLYLAIEQNNIARSEQLLVDLKRLDIQADQIFSYQQLINKTKIYGSYEPFGILQDKLSEKELGPQMLIMPIGSFFMGSDDGKTYQQPAHLVTFNYGFAVSKTEITVAQFKYFIKHSDYITSAKQNRSARIYDKRTGRIKNKYNIDWRHDYTGKKAKAPLPVIHVSWKDAKAYTNWLSEQTGHNYRLITESEFEYVLSAGNSYKYPWGNTQPKQILGNFTGKKDRMKKSREKGRAQWSEGFEDYNDGHWGPAPVASFIPNLYGLFDLSGNVMEWVLDCWHDSYIRAPNDGRAWVNPGCEDRVIRGGSWSSPLNEYQTKHRYKATETFTDPRLGFRIVRIL